MLPAHVKYVALSHCWGHIEDKIMLTEDNLPAFQKELPDLRCLQTFQDAMIAARNLGFQYIWIDTLCIFQGSNSEGDWLKEASLMSSVYKYATLTITATSAKADTEGCFFNRDITNYFPTRISVEARNGKGQQSLTFEVGDLPSPQDWEFDVQESPVNGRSWVLQEWLLSPRVLHYSENQLYWECNEMIASECQPWGIPGIKSKPNPTRSSARISTSLLPTHLATQGTLPTLPSKLGGLFRRDLTDTWMNLIELYTKGDLTDPRDKLVAISALAREAYGVQQCRYLAGLWERDLIFELGWMSYMSSLPTRRLKNGQELPINHDDLGDEQYKTRNLYRAPSWSWAAVDGQVRYPYNNENIGSSNIHPLISNIIPWVKLRTEDLYGQVTNGYLTALAHVIIVTLTESEPPGPETQVIVRGYDVVTPGSVFRDDLNGIFGPDSDEVLLMPLLLSFFGTDSFLFTALLLKHEHEDIKPRNVYKRVGAVNWQSDKAALERDPGLNLILSSAGKIQWNGGSCAHFERDTSRLQKIKIV